MADVSKILHKGKEILLVDYRGCVNEEEMLKIMRKAQQIIIEDNREYLQLVDFRGTIATSIYMNEAKKIAKETPKLATKRAIVGINNKSREILLQVYNLVIGKKGLKPFETLEEAKDWLTE